jgi:hypothetical protein
MAVFQWNASEIEFLFDRYQIRRLSASVGNDSPAKITPPFVRKDPMGFDAGSSRIDRSIGKSVAV